MNDKLEKKSLNTYGLNFIILKLSTTMKLKTFLKLILPIFLFSLRIKKSTIWYHFCLPAFAAMFQSEILVLRQQFCLFYLKFFINYTKNIKLPIGLNVVNIFMYIFQVRGIHQRKVNKTPQELKNMILCKFFCPLGSR